MTASLRYVLIVVFALTLAVAPASTAQETTPEVPPPTETPTDVPTATWTETATQVPTATLTEAPTVTETQSPTEIVPTAEITTPASETPTEAPTSTATDGETLTPIFTETSVSPTVATATETSTASPESTESLPESTTPTYEIIEIPYTELQPLAPPILMTGSLADNQANRLQTMQTMHAGHFTYVEDLEDDTSEFAFNLNGSQSLNGYAIIDAGTTVTSSTSPALETRGAVARSRVTTVSGFYYMALQVNIIFDQPYTVEAVDVQPGYFIYKTHMAPIYHRIRLAFFDSSFTQIGEVIECEYEVDVSQQVNFVLNDTNVTCDLNFTAVENVAAVATVHDLPFGSYLADVYDLSLDNITFDLFAPLPVVCNATTTTGANLRATPGGALISSVPSGQQIGILGQYFKSDVPTSHEHYGVWYFIRYGDTEGWVINSVVSPQCPEAPPLDENGNPVNLPPPPIPGSGDCMVQLNQQANVITIENIRDGTNSGQTVVSSENILPQTQVLINAIHPNRRYASVQYNRFDAQGNVEEGTGWIKIRELRDSEFSGFIPVEAATPACFSNSKLVLSEIERLVQLGEPLLPSCISLVENLDCRPTQICGGDIFCGAARTEIAGWRDSADGCSASGCLDEETGSNPCRLWQESNLENDHCGIDLVTDSGITEVYNIDGGIYCDYSDATHHILVRPENDFGSQPHLWEFQFTHVDDKQINNGSRYHYVSFDVLLGNYGSLGQYPGDTPHVHVVIKAYVDSGGQSLCNSRGAGVTYLNPFDPLTNVSIPVPNS